ncbi:MAG: hypothetical protein WCD86_17260 [Ktedonobacteraceae bacterium]
MNEDQITTDGGPDLLVPPHMLPTLMELFAGDRQRALIQQEQLLAHLAACHHCRTALLFLLSVAQEVDRRNKDPEDVAHDLLVRLAALDRMIEAHRYERVGVYAETVVAEGREKAALLFPALATHLSTCTACRSMVEETVAFILEAQAK